MQCIAHDLTDFKARVELEKDRRAIANLQHEEKNAHQAQEADAARAAKLLTSVQDTLRQPHMPNVGAEPLVHGADEKTRDVAQALGQMERLLNKVVSHAPLHSTCLHLPLIPPLAA